MDTNKVAIRSRVAIRIVLINRAISRSRKAVQAKQVNTMLAANNNTHLRTMAGNTNHPPTARTKTETHMIQATTTLQATKFNRVSRIPKASVA